MFHVRRRPADSQPRRRKKKTGAGASSSAGVARPGNEPLLVEATPDGAPLDNGRRIRLADVLEVGSGNGMSLQLYGPSIQPRHCVVASADGGGAYAVTPLHTDAHVYVNGQRVTHTARLQHGCLVKFGRVSTFRFVDPAQENLGRNLAQSQHFGSGSIYDRSPTTAAAEHASGAMSPASMSSHLSPDGLDLTNANTTDTDYQRTMSPVSGTHHDAYGYGRDPADPTTPYNNNTLKLDDESLMMSQHLSDSKEDYVRDEHSTYNEHETADQQSNTAHRTSNTQYKDNYETTFDLDGNVETKSICSAKSGGSGQDNRMSANMPAAARPGQEAILPAVLEFPEVGQAQFLSAVITRLDPHAPAFKLAPVYTLYLCARYRASTHYRPELTPTERAHKLTAFLHHVATLIHATVQERCTDSAAQAFWMANASELLHFLKCDRHISSFSTQAQELLPTTVQNAFSNLVSCFQEELAPALMTLNSPGALDASEATAPTLQALAAAMVLLRRCRVNAALTIQLFSHLFHYINALVCDPSTVSPRWGSALSARLALLGAWAERQGLELAADCHLARVHQAARLIQGEYRTADEARAALATCFKLNSAQVRALLAPLVPADVVEAAAAHARALADELYRADGREITLEESEWLGVGLLIPGDGFSAEVVRGVPPGLAEFVAPLQRARLCRLAHQPHAIGVWTVYMTGYGAPHQRRPPEPRVHIIQLNKNSNGMGLSIVAAKGAGQSKLGIYIKSVVAGGAAAADGRLAAGDQLLSVDGHSLVGITQEKAAEYLVRTGPTVTLEVAKQGAVLHGLATLLHQPAYNQRQEEEEDEVLYEDRVRRNSGTFTNPHPALLRPTPPLLELVTAGNISLCDRHRYYHESHRNVREEFSDSSSDESEECRPHFHTSIPRLIITLDHENNQLKGDGSPDTPGCPLELKGSNKPPSRPIPVFTFTCEDADERADEHADESADEIKTQQSSSSQKLVSSVPETGTYDQSSDSGDVIFLPPEMKPIDTKLTLELFKSNIKEDYKRRCTVVGECVSACDCCRSPQPENPQIPFIDEPNYEPIIFENDVLSNKVVTPKARRILPSLSLDKSDDMKPETSDVMCQTPSSSALGSDVIKKSSTAVNSIKNNNKTDLKLDISSESKHIEDIECRLKRTMFDMVRSFSIKSEDTEGTSFSVSESCNVTTNDECAFKTVCSSSEIPGGRQILDSVERKSWKSPDEFRPIFGRVKALTKQFNDMNLKYKVKSYKRNCQSSPNLSVKNENMFKTKENLQASMSLTDIQCEYPHTDTSETSKEDKLTDDEVKSILIQLEDWSKYGSRGSGDTLAQGNEFELPNLPSEEPVDGNVPRSTSLLFAEIVERKPRTITLDNIIIKSNHPNSHTIAAKKTMSDCLNSRERIDGSEPSVRRVAAAAAQKCSSLVDVSVGRSGQSEAAGSYRPIVQSCPNIDGAHSTRGRRALSAGAPHLSCPTLSRGSGNAVRRASERDLPARLAAEPVKPSKSTPALHHLTSPPHPINPPHHHHLPSSGPPMNTSGGMWTGSKSRSSHNLSAPTAAPAAPAPGPGPAPTHAPQHSPQDAFYQNISTVQAQSHALADRWSSLRSSTGSSRPQSSHYTAESPAPAALTTTVVPSPLSEAHHHQTNQNNTMSVRAVKLAEMSEEVTRRQQHQQQMQYQQQQQQQKPQQKLQSNMPQALHHGPVQPQHPPSTHSVQQQPQGGHTLQMQQPMYHNQHVIQQRYDWHPPGPPSPQRTQPPVAPKPQTSRRNDTEIEEQQQSTGSGLQADDEWYVASALEPPAVSVYPVGSAGTGAGGSPRPAPHNPWQREEREREAEARRAAARARRDATIAHLVSLGGARTPHQNQQLRALQLERDFERRATQHDQEEGVTTEETSGPESPPPAEEGPRAPPQPKSILKSNTRTDLSNGYNTEMVHANMGVGRALLLLAIGTLTSEVQRMQSTLLVLCDILQNVIEESRTSTVTSVSTAIGNLNVNEAPPPPPERGSSFAAMAVRARALSPHAVPHHATLAAHHSPASTANASNASPAMTVARDKRVSFHERPPAPPASSPPPDDEPPPAPAAPPPPAPATTAAPLPHREDPDRFFAEAESMLAEGASPVTSTASGAPHALAHGHTPGVIGAQEVYRDPRARRLAEQQARASTTAVPEQLSFKEKMKMFALESGEAATPKDKVKISRAQRDIDAVH
ncbi:Afadin [Eumeta japonica]|uniref:Afadin n=1 Tax=Eumeta variegata TaxID=151549 RepID=A0A4C1ZUS7_EUMVA|nr:Afadin [Eumeta japonica]